jgi:hypothetical protein
VAEQGWQFEKPVAPVTIALVGEEAVPDVQ